MKAPTLSLPSGGGAIRSIGEKFSSNPVTGTASLTIPIATSPGRAGFDVSLQLAYDSGSGNGPFGIGWHLSVPAITRKTDKGLPRYLDSDESDVFLLSGAEDLVPSREPAPHREGHSIQRYRPRTEGLFARIERWTGDAGDVHWRVTTRDNITSIYGRSADARIADPTDPRLVFSWLLEETRDDRGNIALYTYKREDGAGVDTSELCESHRSNPQDGAFLATAQRYLKRIRYGNQRPNDASTFWFEVVFDYGEHDSAAPTPDDSGRAWTVRRDPFSSYRAGFEVRTYRLCRRVLMFHTFAELGPTPCLVRSTDLTYDEGPVVTYLTEATQSGYTRDAAGVYRKATLPPLSMQYARPVVHDTLSALDDDSLEGLAAGVEGTGAQWVDLDGEGIPGVLTSGDGGWFYKANLGEGKLAPPVVLRSLPVAADLRGGFQQLTDIDGDGRLELVRYSQPLPGYFSRTEENSWEPFAALRALPNIDWRDPNLRMLDLDGDGFADAVIAHDDAFIWYRSRAREGFDPGVVLNKRRDEREGPAVLFSDSSEAVLLADMSGDGLVDIVRVRNGEVCYWPNLGFGRFGRKVTMSASPRLDRPDQFDPRRVHFGDIDGSGTSDLFYLGRDGVVLYFNHAGNGFSDPTVIRSLPVTDTLGSTSIVDVLGHGTACLLWSSPAPASASRPIAYVDLMGGTKPHLLTSHENNLGARTVLHYAPSTTFYLADKRAGKPWLTRLAFPVHVLERVEVHDEISRNRFVTRYAYHHGYFDGEEREFRGFGLVEQWDTEEFVVLSAGDELPQATNLDPASHVPPVHTKTWFHTGAFLGAERISRAYAAEYYREPGVRPSGPDDPEKATKDAAFAGRLLPDTVLPAGLSAADAREACRALRGSVLRQEVYGLDGTARAEHPYSVSERNYTVEVLQAKGTGRHGVFLTHARETLDWHHERAPEDPRVSHAVVLEVNAFGEVTKSAAVGYGRRKVAAELGAEDRKKQTTALVTYTENAFTNGVDTEGAYRTPAPCESVTWEISGLSFATGAERFSFDELRSAAGTASLLDYEAPTVGPPGRHKRPVEHTRTLYRKNDLSGPLPLGALESLALPYESYKLAFTPGLVTAVYGARVTDALLREGGYVQSAGVAGWWTPSGRICYSPDPKDTAAVELAEARAHFFLPRRFEDPFGSSTTVRYAHDLLLQETVDALGNRVTVGVRASDPERVLLEDGYDYRVLQPRLVMDPNRNRSAAAFDALGLVVGTAVMGKPEEQLGDSLTGFQADLGEGAVTAHLAAPLADPHALLQRATTRLVYDLHAFFHSKNTAAPRPAVVCTLARETHESELRAGEGTPIQHAFTYSDGFGREIQKKAQAEPGADGKPRWVGSGWTVFNNKGKPVRKFEPFFTNGHGFERDRRVGVSSVLFYDPKERVVATLHPDHTWEKVLFDPWHQETWDRSDTVVRKASQDPDPRKDPDVGGLLARMPDEDVVPTWYEQRIGGARGAEAKAAAKKAAVHAETPTVAYFDTLGRPFLTVAQNRYERDGLVTEERHETRTVLDIEGNEREVIDALGRVVMRYPYDMLGNRLGQDSMEAGARRALNDVAGKPVYAWDSRGHTFQNEYDALRRPVRAWVVGADPKDLGRRILHGKTEYGEGQSDDVTRNLRGQVFRQYDGAGVVTHAEYDFEGNLFRSRRELAVEYKETLDWSRPVPLEPGDVFETWTRYDALKRPVELRAPDGSLVHPKYNEGNLLNGLAANLHGAAASTTFIEDLDYNAKGQRTAIRYGNGVVTEYSYDPETFRMVRLQTTRRGGTELLQDLAYTFDSSGNITHLRDSAQQPIFFANAKVEPVWEYAYDAVYRLIEATGREHLGQVGGRPVPTSDSDAPRVGLAHPNDRNAMGLYRERYDYDQVGNILELAHRGTDPQNPGWTRSYGYQEASLLEPELRDAQGRVVGPGRKNNRLSTTKVGEDPTLKYGYDAGGNMVSMPHLPVMRWDAWDRLAATSRQDVQNGGTPELTYYVYDGAGQRVRKVTEGQAKAGETPVRVRERLYLGGFEVARDFAAGAVTVERQTLHVMDDKRRVALVETRTKGMDRSPQQMVRFQLDNHLGSACLEVDGTDSAEIVSYEEYYPYGSTAYQAVSGATEVPKRYRYTGMERDEESGLAYHRARYYAPWLGRWVSCDPAGIKADIQLFGYAHGRPLGLVDATGLAPTEPDTVSSAKAWVERARETRAAQHKAWETIRKSSEAIKSLEDRLVGVKDVVRRMERSDPAQYAKLDLKAFADVTRQLEVKISEHRIRIGDAEKTLRDVETRMDVLRREAGALQNKLPGSHTTAKEMQAELAALGSWNRPPSSGTVNTRVTGRESTTDTLVSGNRSTSLASEKLGSGDTLVSPKPTPGAAPPPKPPPGPAARLRMGRALALGARAGGILLSIGLGAWHIAASPPEDRPLVIAEQLSLGVIPSPDRIEVGRKEAEARLRAAEQGWAMSTFFAIAEGFSMFLGATF